MKKVIAILLAASALVFISCESTKQEDVNGSEERTTYRASDKDAGGKKESPTASGTISTKNQFKKFLQDAKITVLSFPKETVKGKAFSAPYKIQILGADGSPIPSTKIIAEFPASKNQESVNYQKAELVTDENGRAEFFPPVPEFAASDKVLFYPAPPSSDPELVRMAAESAAEAQWKAKSNLGARTGILVSIVDYRQNGSINIGNGSQPSAQALTSNLWRSGLMGAQNADFHNSIDADDPARIRSDALKQLNGNTLFKFVVYGRVKYTSEITKDADGYYNVSLNGSLGALNISSGEVLLKASKSVTVKDKAEWKAVDNARQEMAKLFCEELIYSLYN